MPKKLFLFKDAIPEAALKKRSQSAWKKEPHDLVYLHFRRSKEQDDNKGERQQQQTASTGEITAFCNVLGLDVSSCASIAAFLAQMFSQHSNLIKCVFCGWATAFKLDVRVVARNEGSLSAFTLNEWGQCGKVSDEIWAALLQASTIRYMHFRITPNSFPHSWPICVQTGEMVMDESERVKNALFSCNSHHHDDDDGKILKIATTFALRMQITKFTRFDEVAQLQEQAKRLIPIDAELGFEAAKRAIQKSPLESLNWQLAVQALIKQKQWKKALLLMNNCPLREDDEGEIAFSTGDSEILCLSSSPPPKEGKKHHSNEECFVDSLLKPIELANRSQSWKALYLLLCEIHGTIGWESLLEVRSGAFVMETELETDSESFTSAHSPNSFCLLQTEGEREVCEQWLDEMFMVLYEEIKIWSICQVEMHAFKQKGLEYSKNAQEWALIGEIASRVAGVEASISAFQKSLELKFSADTAKKLAQLYLQEDRIMHFLALVAKIFEWALRDEKEILSQQEADWTILLISRWGIQATRKAVSSLAISPEAAGCFSQIFFKVSQMQLSGFDW